MNHPKILHFDDEREIGNSIIVTLVPGWHWGQDSFAVEHVLGFDTKGQVKEALKAIKACTCPECLTLLKEETMQDVKEKPARQKRTTKKSRHGGRRPGAGRPAGKTYTEFFNVGLTEADGAALAALARGLGMKKTALARLILGRVLSDKTPEEIAAMIAARPGEAAND